MKYLGEFFGIVAIISSASACWPTGCELDSWAVVGCPAGTFEKSKEKCDGGYKYECCNAPVGDPAPGNPAPGDPGVGDNDVGQITFEQFTSALTLNGYPAQGRDKYNAFIKAAPSRGGIKSKVEAAMALSQFLHESGGLRYKTEQACNLDAWANCDGGYANQGCEYPGKYYFGRGYIQLTWCYNYKAASLAIFGDDTLLRDPEMVARDEQTAWDTTFWFWADRVRDQPGVSQGQFGASTKAINGALECHGGEFVDKARARFRIYGHVRTAFGLSGPGIESGCYN